MLSPSNKENSKNKSGIEKPTENYQRIDDKRSTLNLSEVPNIITKSKCNSINIPENNNSIIKKCLNSKTFKKSFMNESINQNKEESFSSLEDINNIMTNSKKKETSEVKDETINKDDDETYKNKVIFDSNKKKYHSCKKCFFKQFNNLDKDNNENKNNCKRQEINNVVSDIDLNLNENNNKKRKHRKSHMTIQNYHQEKLYTNDIYKKFCLTKRTLSENAPGKMNIDKIYINIKNKKELLITVNTEQETIKNYYEYMKECFQLIDQYFNKSIKLMPGEPKEFNFNNNKKIVIFELESTLVSNFTIVNEECSVLNIKPRPHLKSSLDLIKKDYNIVIYSSGNKFLVDTILDSLDPQKEYFKYRLYQDNCYKFNINQKIYFTKNLNIFRKVRDLKDIIIVDCSVIGFGFFLENGIPIIPFYDSKDDVELKLLSLYLSYISQNNDIRDALKRDIKLDSYLEMAKEENINQNKCKDKEKELTGKKNKNTDSCGKKNKKLNSKPKRNNQSPKKTKTTREKNHLFIINNSSSSDENSKIINKKTHKGKLKRDLKISPKKRLCNSVKFLKKRIKKSINSELNLNKIFLSPQKISAGKFNKYNKTKNVKGKQ